LTSWQLVEAGRTTSVVYSSRTLVGLDTGGKKDFVGFLELSAKPFAVEPDGSRKAVFQAMNISLEVTWYIL